MSKDEKLKLLVAGLAMWIWLAKDSKRTKEQYLALRPNSLLHNKEQNCAGCEIGTASFILLPIKQRSLKEVCNFCPLLSNVERKVCVILDYSCCNGDYSKWKTSRNPIFARSIIDRHIRAISGLQSKASEEKI